MDFDIEMDDVAMDADPVQEEYTTDIVVGEEQEPGEIDEEFSTQGDDLQSDDRALVPYKVYIRGLDSFTPDDVKAYLKEHSGSSAFEKLEWIDDTSLNYVFGSEANAQEALVALASVEIADATQLPPLESIPAKPFSGKPDSVLAVRFAVAGDKKAVGAAQRSRFYLLHPEYDPEERRRRGEIRGKYRDRDNYGRRSERDRGGGRRSQNRIDEYDVDSFDVNLYDDDDASLAKRTDNRSHSRRGSSARLRDSPESEDGGRRYSRQNREKELFPDRKLGESKANHLGRDRSASPMREHTISALDDLARDREAVGRNREKARALKDRLSTKDKDNTPKELFPSKVSKDLFPSKVSSLATGGKAQMDQVDTRTVLASGMSNLSLHELRYWGLDGCSDAPTPPPCDDSVLPNAVMPTSMTINNVNKNVSLTFSKANLADRITTRPTEPESAFSIRGLATKRAPQQGFAIKGAAEQVKELFPEKSGNAGKELFADRLDGRGRRRQKAEDMFH